MLKLGQEVNIGVGIYGGFSKVMSNKLELKFEKNIGI